MIISTINIKYQISNPWRLLNIINLPFLKSRLVRTASKSTVLLPDIFETQQTCPAFFVTLGQGCFDNLHWFMSVISRVHQVNPWTDSPLRRQTKKLLPSTMVLPIREQTPDIRYLNNFL